MNNMYKDTTSSVETLLNDFKNDNKSFKETSIELERIYKSMFAQFGNKKVYAKYGITKTGKIMIDFKRHGNPISLSHGECLKLNNILSSRNFENYVRSQQDVIDERTNTFFEEKKAKNNRFSKSEDNDTPQNATEVSEATA